ncbi:MAG TPA: hypothetical protein DEG92_00960 [Rikenellaceae bacterium]|nr:hypothetical protein [Rikenellaceae bacterium]
MKRAVVILLHIACSAVVYSQNTGQGVEVTQLYKVIEIISEELVKNDNSSIEEAVEYLESLAENPIDINSATFEEMEHLPLFSSFMISSVVDYRREFGNILSIDELSFVPGFDRKIAEMLSHFIKLSANDSPSPVSLRSLINDSRSQLLFRWGRLLEKQNGYTPVSSEEWERNPNSRYLSFPGKQYLQYKYEYPGRIKFSFTTERDPGEIGADLIGVSLAAEDLGIFRRVIIGDFSARFAQGLVLWNSFSINSFREPSSFKKSESGITQYSSTDENISFRGLAASAILGKFNVSAFISNKYIDARIIDGGYTSLLTTGMHNTKTTLERKHSLRVSLAGENISFSGKNFRIGQTTVFYKYGLPYVGRDSVLLARTAKFGTLGANISLDFYAVLGKTRLFSEAAMDIGGSFAFIAGTVWSPSGSFELSSIVRYYSNNYYSPFGGAYTSAGKIQDERGISAGVKWNTYRKWILTSSLDWQPFEKEGKFIAEAEYNSENPLSGYVRFTAKNSGNVLRINCICETSYAFALNARGEITSAYGIEGENKFGLMIYCEPVYNSPSGKFSASLRVASFYIPDWKLRIYAYERDVLYGFSVPAFNGKGIRGYLNLRWETFRWLTLWLRIAQTRYFDRDKTGEGPEEISGPSKSDFKIEARIKF